MRRCNIEATNENVLKSIEYDRLGRSADVKDFILFLEEMESNVFIALDAAWGDGKTFFVRQVEKTLSYYNKKAFQLEISQEEKKVFDRNKLLGNLELNKTYLPIYFNAWLYDNHADPLMALLLVMVKHCGKYVDTTLHAPISEKLFAIVNSIDLWENFSWNKSNLKATNLKEFKESVSNKDILSEIKTLEEIRTLIKDIFDKIIVESGEKLIIFIDELDRCKPTFAVEMLESVKHYFEDDRIIFVMSVNKAQLVHTISRFYGEGFDSCGYLNKFFDISIQLSQGNGKRLFTDLGINCDSYLQIDAIANDLQKNYNLSLRDTALYFQKINIVKESINNNYNYNKYIEAMLYLFVPIICILQIKDIESMNKVVNGNGFTILKELVMKCENIREWLNILPYYESDTLPLEEFEKIYLFAFGKAGEGWYSPQIQIPATFKIVCMRFCNGFCGWN